MIYEHFNHINEHGSLALCIINKSTMAKDF